METKNTTAIMPEIEVADIKAAAKRLLLYGKGVEILSDMNEKKGEKCHDESAGV